MQAFLIIACIITCSIQNVFKKEYGQKTEKGEYIFSLMTSFFALCFFLLITKNISFNLTLLPYAVFFALCYAIATITIVFAMKIGSLTLTSLFVSYSLIIPTLNGLIFLGDKATATQYIGIAALLISIFLVREKSAKTEEEKRVSLKWIIYVLLAFLANGFCSVIQNAQKVKFGGQQDGNFMIISLIMVVVFFAGATLACESKTFKQNLKKGLFLGALNGLSNGATNWLVMMSLSFVASSVFFPLISAGGIITAFVCSLIFYKEKFIPRQIVGLIFGIIALVFLNI